MAAFSPNLGLAFWGIFTIITILFFKPSHQKNYTPPPSIKNPRLWTASIALQAWKYSITSDPSNFTSNWHGPKVCNYNGVYCAAAPDDPHIKTVAGIDLNHAGISGHLTEELGLLTDLALFHINSNYFSGNIPNSFTNLHLLYELDISNNQFTGKFPYVVLSLPSLKFLDIRFNKFHGKIPPQLFNLNLDAIFINNNKFESSLPKNFGNSPASAIVIAHNNFNGCIPSSLTKMAGTLNEIILMDMGLTGCLQPDIGLLNQLTVFDVSSNKLVGNLPNSIGQMKKLEHLNVAHNKFSGEIPASICKLPNLENFTYSDNYFCGEPPACLKLAAKDGRLNCIVNKPLRRSLQKCKSFYAHPIACGCSSGSTPPPLPPSPPPPYYHHYP